MKTIDIKIIKGMAQMTVDTLADLLKGHEVTVKRIYKKKEEAKKE